MSRLQGISCVALTMLSRRCLPDSGSPLTSCRAPESHACRRGPAGPRGHLDCLVLDGVYRGGVDGTPEFVEVPEPTDETMQSVLRKIITRSMKLLASRGGLVEEEGSTYIANNDSDSDEARTLRSLQAAACTYRIAFGPRAGQKLLTVQAAMPRDADFKQHLCADIDGFSLHAAVRCGADDRQALEQLCCYITRPALCQRTGGNQRRWTGGAKAQDSLARRHRALGHVAAGVHVTTNRWTALRHRVLRGLRQLRVDLSPSGQRRPVMRGSRSRAIRAQVRSPTHC